MKRICYRISLPLFGGLTEDRERVKWNLIANYTKMNKRFFRVFEIFIF